MDHELYDEGSIFQAIFYIEKKKKERTTLCLDTNIILRLTH